jgi:hypothetical protein
VEKWGQGWKEVESDKVIEGRNLYAMLSAFRKARRAAVGPGEVA